MASNPPRFVPTLTEAVSSLTPTTEVDDHDYFESKDDSPDSMLDFDLDDLDGPISRIEQVSPLGDYQGECVANPAAITNIPVVSKPMVKRSVAAPPSVSAQHMPKVDSEPNTLEDHSLPPRVTATLRPAPVAEKPSKSILPEDWQDQLQQSIKQAVRQELQQQMPFLLLQWSKQIEDKLSPQIHQKLVRKIEIWLKK